MQTLRDSLLLASQKFDALYESQSNELKDFKTYSVCTFGMHKEKMKAQEEAIAEHKQTIQDFHEQLRVIETFYATKSDMHKLKKYMEEKADEATTANLLSWQQLQREMKDLLKQLRDDFEKYKDQTNRKFDVHSETEDRNFNVNRIDREGVLKEVRVWEKTIFIIEKKIENIYTLIERINKRG